MSHVAEVQRAFSAKDASAARRTPLIAAPRRPSSHAGNGRRVRAGGTSGAVVVFIIGLALTITAAGYVLFSVV